MGKQTTTLRGISRLKLNVRFFPNFFFLFLLERSENEFDFSRFDSLLGFFGSWHPCNRIRTLERFGAEMDEANRQADERLPKDFADNKAQKLIRENQEQTCTKKFGACQGNGEC